MGLWWLFSHYQNSLLFEDFILRGNVLLKKTIIMALCMRPKWPRPRSRSEDWDTHDFFQDETLMHLKTEPLRLRPQHLLGRVSLTWSNTQPTTLSLLMSYESLSAHIAVCDTWHAVFWWLSLFQLTCLERNVAVTQFSGKGRDTGFRNGTFKNSRMISVSDLWYSASCFWLFSHKQLLLVETAVYNKGLGHFYYILEGEKYVNHFGITLWGSDGKWQFPEVLKYPLSVLKELFKLKQFA